MKWKSRAVTALVVTLLAVPAAHAAGDGPAYDWSGPYVGIHGGYAWNSTHWSNPDDPNAVNFGNTFDFTTGDHGFVAGGHGGYNFQFDHIVLGVEVSGDYVGIDHRVAVPGILDPATLRTKPHWLASVGPRIGYAFDRALVYGSAGLAFSRYKFSDRDPSLCCTPAVFAVNYPSQIWAGWTLGAGGEYAVTDNLTAGIDYKHYDFGASTVASTALAGPGFDLIHIRETEDVLTARISFKFGVPPRPPVAEAPPPAPAPPP